MTDSRPNERVKVVVRCRPMNAKEIQSGFHETVEVFSAVNAIRIFNPLESDTEGKTFTFDAVYDCNCTQEHLYKQSVQPVIDSVLNGFNGTIFAYGQTGTGKTFTMEGDPFDSSQEGVILQAFKQIFNRISQSKDTQYLVRASYIEIYQEEVKDLLDNSGESYHELVGDGSGIYIKNLKSHICRTENEMADVMTHGKRNRKVGATDMNEHSSRSHAIFIITIEMSNIVSGVNHVRVGKLNLVDLAGSERQSKSCTIGKRLKEASKINLSLSALGNVISALSNGKNFHVPYRDSKLTRLLQDSLGGNSKTLMIANIGPASYNYNESLTTLRYASRAKNIKNKPIVNEDPKDALIRQYKDEIERLKRLVQSKYENHRKPKFPIKSTIVNKHDTTNESQSPSASCSISDDAKLIQIQEEIGKQQQLLIQETAQNIETLETKIRLMESRILKGTDIVEHTNKQQQILQQQAEEIEKRTKRKIELEQLLEKEEETTEELQDSHLTLQQNIESKSKKLCKLFSKLCTIKGQTADAIEEFNNDRNTLEVSQNDLIKEYKLNQIIIDNFISDNDKANFMASVYYDEQYEEWETNYIKNSNQQRLFATRHQRRPESEYSRILAKLNYNWRFKCDNLISLDMERAQQTTSRYKIPVVSPIVKCALNDALKKEEDITVNTPLTNLEGILKQGKKYSSETINDKFEDTKYPTVRGLVKRK